jgi:TolB-like protein/AraC-like DNA-binding protein/Tfp pilus assembly protein PilF
MQRLDQFIEQHLTDEAIGVGHLASAIGYSRSHLHRKVLQASGKSVSQYIREYRLEKAYTILKEEDLNVSEVAFRVGFGSASYFSRTFTKYFGFPPSETGSVDIQADPSNGKQVEPQNKKSRTAGMLIPLVVIVLLVISSVIFVQSRIPERRFAENGNETSIAILPFANLSDDPENLYLSQGISDAIARKLSGIENLRVVSRISTSQYMENHTPVVQIARDLNTPFVLEGSIQRFGNKIRFEAGLLNGTTGIRLWSENFDRDYEDIFEIENEIAEHVAQSLSMRLTPNQDFEANQGYTANPEAYDLYLKGLFELRTYTSAGARKSTEYFQRAVELDPSFAMAHNWLGHSYIARAAMFGMDLNALEGLELAIEHIERSIEISPELKESRAIRAFYYLYHDWDFEKAEKEYLASLNKIQAESYALYADYLNFVRRHEEALDWCEKQEKNEPYYPNPRKILTLFYLDRVEEAIEYAENRLRVQKNYWMMDTYGFVLLNSGAHEKAINVFQEIFQIEQQRYPRILGWLGAAYARSGSEEKAREIIAELSAMKSISSASSPGFFIAVVYSALGEHESALQWLRTAVDDHEMEIPWLISEPQFFDMHEHPKFKNLVAEVGFP